MMIELLDFDLLNASARFSLINNEFELLDKKKKKIYLDFDHTWLVNFMLIFGRKGL